MQPPSLFGSGNNKYCAAYQLKKPGLGQIACPFSQRFCPYGMHKCWGCGKSGHGKADCKQPVAELAEPAAAEQSGRQRRTQPAAEPAEPAAAEQSRPQKSMRISEVWPPSMSIELMIWRPSRINVHGFACIFQFACSMMSRALENKCPLYIDLDQSNILYDSFGRPASKANWWSDIFPQPYVKLLQNEPETTTIH